MSTSHRTPGWFSRVRRWLHHTPVAPRATRTPASLTWDESDDAALMKHLYGELKRVTPLRASYWIMNPAWYQDIRNLRDAYGNQFWYSGPCSAEAAAAQHLLGVRVRVNEDAGLPVLVPYGV